MPEPQAVPNPMPAPQPPAPAPAPVQSPAQPAAQPQPRQAEYPTVVNTLTPAPGIKIQVVDSRYETSAIGLVGVALVKGGALSIADGPMPFGEIAAIVLVSEAIVGVVVTDYAKYGPPTADWMDKSLVVPWAQSQQGSVMVGGASALDEAIRLWDYAPSRVFEARAYPEQPPMVGPVADHVWNKNIPRAAERSWCWGDCLNLIRSGPPPQCYTRVEPGGQVTWLLVWWEALSPVRLLTGGMWIPTGTRAMLLKPWDFHNSTAVGDPSGSILDQFTPSPCPPGGPGSLLPQ